MNKTSKIEKLKSIVIVVLFLCTMLLLYFFWEDVKLSDISLADFAFEEEELIVRSYLPADLVVPSRLVACFGDGEYTVINDTAEIFHGGARPSGSQSAAAQPDNEQTKGFLAGLRSFLASSEVFSEEITAELYAEAFSYRSVKAVFNYYLSYADFCDYFKIQNPSAVNIKAVNEIGFSEANANSLFLYDSSAEKYYRIVADNPSGYLEEFFAQIAENGYFYYYSMNVYLGENVENDLLLPLYMESDMRELSARPQSEWEEEALSMEAKRFFGSTFDFVRKIEETGGKVIYMYGYADKLLIADVDGSLEYKNETDENRNTTGYFQSLDTALRFIDIHGGFFSAPDGENQPYLRAAVRNPDGKKGYRFEFGVKCGGNEIFTDQNYAVAVEVINGAVSYFYKSVPQVEAATGSGEPQETFSAINMLANNYEYIHEKIMAAGGQAGSGGRAARRVSFEEVSEDITSVTGGYLVSGELLRPVWKVNARGLSESLYFDLYTAEPVL